MGYGEAPWRFTGQALYQLQLVKADDAKKYVPEGLKLVEAFGYTLGGFYLARYRDSPVGSFDELVVMGGLVWNPPTSCAWAARVYVSNKGARNHGLRSCGLPSRLARFQEQSNVPAGDSLRGSGTWWDQPRMQTSLRGGGDGEPRGHPGLGKSVVLRNTESRWFWPFGKGRGMSDPVVSMDLPTARQCGRWPGPRIKVVLPSFSGLTRDHPSMLRYVCDLKTNVRLTTCAKLLCPVASENDKPPHPESVAAVLAGKPLVAFAFDDMIMEVAEPEIVLGKGIGISSAQEM